jgi:putative inorganic carbon (HCO3(-)) transporter
MNDEGGQGRARPFTEPQGDIAAAAASIVMLAAAAVLLWSASLPAWVSLAAAGGLAAAFLARAVATGHMTGHTPADWPLLALVLLLPVGLWASADRAVTLERTYAFFAAAAVFWITAAQAEQPWLRYTGWALLLAGLAMALAVIAATPLSGGVMALGPVSSISQAMRILLPFLQPDRFNPNLSGQLLGVFLAPAAAFALLGAGGAPGRRMLRVAAAALSLLLALLLLLTQSRGAVLGVAVALAVMTTLANRRWLLVWIPLGLALLAAVMMLGGGVLPPLLNAGSGAMATVQGRQELWSRALFVMQDFPFTGVGLGMPEQVINLLYPLFLVGPDTQWLHVHNTYLQIGSEMGIPGLIAFVALLFAIGAALTRQAASRIRPAPWRTTLALGLLGSLIVFAVHGLVDAPLASPKLTVLFFGLLGLMAAVSSEPAQGGPSGVLRKDRPEHMESGSRPA